MPAGLILSGLPPGVIKFLLSVAAIVAFQTFETQALRTAMGCFVVIFVLDCLVSLLDKPFVKKLLWQAAKHLLLLLPSRQQVTRLLWKIFRSGLPHWGGSDTAVVSQVSGVLVFEPGC